MSIVDMAFPASGAGSGSRSMAFVMDEIDKSVPSRISEAAWPNLSPRSCLHRSVLGPAPLPQDFNRLGLVAIMLNF